MIGMTKLHLQRGNRNCSRTFLSEEEMPKEHCHFASKYQQPAKQVLRTVRFVLKYACGHFIYN